jgi:hypothetical protein
MPLMLTVRRTLPPGWFRAPPPACRPGRWRASSPLYCKPRSKSALLINERESSFHPLGQTGRPEPQVQKRQIRTRSIGGPVTPK